MISFLICTSLFLNLASCIPWDLCYECMHASGASRSSKSLFLSQEPTFIPLHQSYFLYISIIMVMGAQKWISKGLIPDMCYDLSFPSSVKYFCLWIKPHILQMLSWLKSAELPRWFKKCMYFGGIKAKSQSSTDAFFFFFFWSCIFVLIFCQISCSVSVYGFIQWYKGIVPLFLLPPLCYVAGFLQPLTWNFLIKSPSGQNCSAICSFRWYDKACETSGMSGTVSSQL